MCEGTMACREYFGGEDERREVWSDFKDQLREEIHYGGRGSDLIAGELEEKEAGGEEDGDEQEEARDLEDFWRVCFYEDDHACAAAKGACAHDDKRAPGVGKESAIEGLCVGVFVVGFPDPTVLRGS